MRLTGLVITASLILRGLILGRPNRARQPADRGSANGPPIAVLPDHPAPLEGPPQRGCVKKLTQFIRWRCYTEGIVTLKSELAYSRALWCLSGYESAEDRN